MSNITEKLAADVAKLSTVTGKDLVVTVEEGVDGLTWFLYETKSWLPSVQQAPSIEGLHVSGLIGVTAEEAQATVSALLPPAKAVPKAKK